MNKPKKDDFVEFHSDFLLKTRIFDIASDYKFGKIVEAGNNYFVIHPLQELPKWETQKVYSVEELKGNMIEIRIFIPY